MSIIKSVFFLCILSIAVVNGRALRQRRQAVPNSLRQDVGNFFTNSYNTIRDSVAPAVSSTVDGFSQNWDGFKQNFNQGVNQIGQRWDGYRQNFNQGVNQFSQGWDGYKQNFNQGVNQIGQRWDGYKQNFNQGWNQFRQNFNPQYPYSNNNNNYAYNQYGYNARQYPYSVDNNNNVRPNMYPNGMEAPRGYNPPYTNNVGQQQYQNFGGQQRSNGPVVAPPFSTYSDPRPRRRR